jgi:nucleolar protein 12
VPERNAQSLENGTPRQPKATTNGRAKDEESSFEAISSLGDEDEELSKLKEEESTPPRKRRKIRQEKDIESTYLHKLAKKDATDAARSKSTQARKQQKNTNDEAEEELTSSAGESEDGDAGLVTNDADGDLPQHESLAKTAAVSDSDKMMRTVFLGNVSTSAIKSKSAKNTLLDHLRSAVRDLPERKPAHKVESLRFRSTAFASGAGPKKAAFLKGELMDQTTHSTNAYVVYTTELAALRAAPKLNGTVVLDRHLRADSLAMPTRIEHRRCVFVGNLSFVDEETQDQTNDDGTPHRPKAKVPADAEEGLWRAFSKVGKVESVRVVRDKETRIGKGFAYVQFFDENAVEAALLMNDKKFPPMLPRKLRVMRAKRTKQKAIGGNNANKATNRDSRRQVSGRADKRFVTTGKPGMRNTSGPRTKEGVIFEGHRASKSSRESNVVSKHRKRHAVKPSTRSSKRGAAFKAAGGKRAQ